MKDASSVGIGLERARTRFGSSGLPTEIVAAQARRLLWTMYVVVAAMVLYFVIYNTLWIEHASNIARINTVVLIAVSSALVAYLRREPSPRAIACIGIGFEIFVCFTLAITELSELPAGLDQPVGTVSWICVVIILFPFIVPVSPRAMLGGSLASAAMHPIALAVSVTWLDAVAPRADIWFSMSFPPFVCALIAYFPARVMSRLGAEVGRARQLGSYHLVERIGAGGMGEVWRASHKLLVRPAAIKLIKPEMLADSRPGSIRRPRERFEREAQATALLESPHTVELYDFGVAEDGTFYYVMELLRGVDLETLVRRHGPVSPERAVHVLVQVCDSLGEAHDSGLIHRDIKPANIVVAHRAQRFDFVKVLDFGLVTAGPSTATAVDAGETGDNVIKGTPAYLSPEAVTGDHEVDGRSDLYALGCVAYWLLTGELVFDAATGMKMAIAHATEDPPPMSARGAAVPEALESIVCSCLAKDPGDRPISAAALRLALDALELPAWTQDRAGRWWTENEAELLAAEGTPEPIESAKTILVIAD